MAHGKFKNFKDYETTESDKDGGEETVLAEGNKFEEIAEEWNGENYNHNANNYKEKSAAEMVERAGNPINKE